MELTQEEIKWIKDRYAEESAVALTQMKNDKIEKAREKVGKKHEKQLKKLADEGKIEERKALIEQITQEANEAELSVLGTA